MADWSRQCRGADDKDLLIQMIKVTPKVKKGQKKKAGFHSNITAWASKVHASVHST